MEMGEGRVLPVELRLSPQLWGVVARDGCVQAQPLRQVRKETGFVHQRILVQFVIKAILVQFVIEAILVQFFI